VLYLSYRLYCLDINYNYLKYFLIYLVVFYWLHVYLLLIILLLKLIYIFRAEEIEKVWKLWSIKCLEYSKNINSTFILNMYYCLLGHLIITVLNIIKKLIIKLIKLVFFFLFAVFIIKNHWVYSWLLSEIIEVAYELTLNILYHFYFLTDYFEICPKKKGMNLALWLEDYIHLYSFCLDFFKIKENLFVLLLDDGLYVPWEVMRTQLEIFDYNWLLWGWMPKIMWANVFTNCVTYEVGYKAGFLIFISGVLLLIWTHIKIKISILILWIFFFATETFYIIKLLICCWLDMSLLKFRSIMFSIYFYYMDGVFLMWLAYVYNALLLLYNNYIYNYLLWPFLKIISIFITILAWPIYNIFEVSEYYLKKLYLKIQCKIHSSFLYNIITNILGFRFFVHMEDAITFTTKSILNSLSWLLQDILPETKTIKYIGYSEYVSKPNFEWLGKVNERLILIKKIWYILLNALLYLIIKIMYMLQKSTLLSNDLVMDIIWVFI
jgi:hypothetical protein